MRALSGNSSSANIARTQHPNFLRRLASGLGSLAQLPELGLPFGLTNHKPCQPIPNRFTFIIDFAPHITKHCSGTTPSCCRMIITARSAAKKF